MKTIQVLGTGCTECMQLHDNAKKAAEQLQTPYTIEKVTDLQKIMMMGMMSTPALAVDGKVVVSGRVPDVEAIKVMLAVPLFIGFVTAGVPLGVTFSFLIAVVIGVPMYSNAAGIIPVVQTLLGKGAALGTVLAFMMSVIALSLPEAVILRKVPKPRLIAVFFGIVATGILLVGYLFNMML